MSHLTLDQANTIIRVALEKARALNLPPVAVAILDEGGHLKALQREDGLSFLRVKVCQAKAWGAVGLASSSRAIGERYIQDDLQAGFITSLYSISGGQVVPVPGGVLIRDKGGAILGAVGVSGAKSEDDEACAIAGIEAAGFTPDAGL